jgi:hypothetical protein
MQSEVSPTRAQPACQYARLTRLLAGAAGLRPALIAPIDYPGPLAQGNDPLRQLAFHRLIGDNSLAIRLLDSEIEVLFGHSHRWMHRAKPG